MAEPGIVRRHEVAPAPPTRFAGRGEPARQAAAARPHGDLISAGIEEVQQVVRGVWPGGVDAVRRRSRGAGFLLEHLAGFPGQTWQERWEASGLDGGGHPVTAVRNKQKERDVRRHPP